MGDNFIKLSSIPYVNINLLLMARLKVINSSLTSSPNVQKELFIIKI